MGLLAKEQNPVYLGKGEGRFSWQGFWVVRSGIGSVCF